MKNSIKKAVTLTEILVALSIIGVVATLTIPQVSVSVQRNKNAAVLGRVVQIMETGCAQMIEEANSKGSSGQFYTTYGNLTARNIYGSSAAANNITNRFLAYGAPFFRLSEITIPDDYSINNYDGTESTYTAVSASRDSNDESMPKINYMSVDKLGAYIGANASGTSSIPMLIFVDTNADNKPNKLGEDIFMFGLDESCKMIPAGSQEIKNLAGGTLLSDGNISKLNNRLKQIEQTLKNPYLTPLARKKAESAKQTIEDKLNSHVKAKNTGAFNGLYTDTCKDGEITKGLTCTARVVNDGFKIKY